MKQKTSERRVIGNKEVKKETAFEVRDIQCPPGMKPVKQYNRKTGTFVTTHCRKLSYREKMKKLIGMELREWR
ncbi:hypothetical protein [Cuniculiplasma divulgatum]|uniref:hypothetical protein n=1 Tax=Cuniculiplasma divulgatum TaxID=1673428 RepID=UPI0011AE2077|nr:hypothetical protein [Cuniculiplasma divulgatum]MCI2412785.1 hypothetical protein [Cuniculiplasma sp.]